MIDFDFKPVEEYLRFAKNEMIFVRKFEKDIPHPLLVAFAKEFHGLSQTDVKMKQKELLRMYQLSTDADLLNLKLALSGEAEVILKPESYSISQDGKIAIFTKGGTMLTGSVELFGRNLDEIVAALRDWLYVVVTRGNPRINVPNAKIEYVEPLKGNVDFEDARRILKEYDFTPAELLLLGFGVVPTPRTLPLYLPRFLTLFYYDGRPIHVMQLTNTESGKSHYAVRLEFLCNWTHFSEFPSAAKLIYDGRANVKGAVFTSEGISIDEIDKLKKDKFEDCYQPLNTGLENGIWRRGVQTRSGIGLEGYRLIPFLFFGNIVQGETPLLAAYVNNPRDEVLAMLESMTGQNVYSFVERIAICDIVVDKVPITEYLIRNEDGVVGVLKDSTLRALIRIFQDRIEAKNVEPEKECTGRLRRHSEAVYNVLSMLLDRDVGKDVAVDLVLGERTFRGLFIDESKEREEAEPKEPRVIDIDMTKIDS